MADELSPEVDLLERLSAEDASLHEAAFGSCWAFRDLAHAKRAVGVFVEAQAVELYDGQSEAQLAIPFHSARWIIQDDANWETDAPYWLRLTRKGYNQFVEDSASFFERLFRKS
jgi:hypothetical protein